MVDRTKSSITNPTCNKFDIKIQASILNTIQFLYFDLFYPLHKTRFEKAN